MTTPLLRSAMKTVIAGGMDPTLFQWFDMTNAVKPDTQAAVEPLMTYRPPFEKCFIVADGRTKNHEHYEVMMMLVGTDPEEGITVATWKGPKGVMPRQLPQLVYLVDDNMLRYGPVHEDEVITEEEAQLVLALVGCFYNALSNGSEAHQPYVKPTFTNKRKLAQGKTPTYDWHTVTIEPQKPKGPSQGGTHASPRLHDRRGHIRRLRSGKNVWVKPCKVGDASRGVVFKDYEVRNDPRRTKSAQA